MKIALCYYGNTGYYLDQSRNRMPLPPSVCFESVKKHIVEVNDAVDIFVHSWSKEHELEIISVLRPKSHMVEQQINFNVDFGEHQHIKCLADIKSSIISKVRGFFHGDRRFENIESVRRAYSRWYSTQQVIKLKQDYENYHGVKYDFVMLIRFDIEFYTDILFSNYDADKFYLADPSDLDRLRHNYLISHDDIDYKPRVRRMKDKPFIYKVREGLNLQKTVFWTQPSWKNALFIKAGLNHYNLSDTWFFGGTEIMDRFGDLFQQITKYNPSPHVSSFQHITSIIPKESLCFPFEQFKDFELFRYSKKCGVQHPLGY